jgi:hypothetical protein
VRIAMMSVALTRRYFNVSNEAGVELYSTGTCCAQMML